jgi:hypothetical protein
METSNNHTQHLIERRIAACSVCLFIIALGFFDTYMRNRVQPSSGPDFIQALILVVPLSIVSFFIYRVFIRKVQPTRQLILSVLLGVPVSFLSVLLVLSLTQH